MPREENGSTIIELEPPKESLMLDSKTKQKSAPTLWLFVVSMSRWWAAHVQSLWLYCDYAAAWLPAPQQPKLASCGKNRSASMSTNEFLSKDSLEALTTLAGYHAVDHVAKLPRN